MRAAISILLLNLLASSGWLVTQQKETPAPKESETQAAVFMVEHTHPGQAFNYCYGWLTISKDQIKYASKNRDDGFGIVPSEVKKVDRSLRTTGDPSRPFRMLDVKLILRDGNKHTFVPVDDALQKQDAIPLFKTLNSAVGR